MIGWVRREPASHQPSADHSEHRNPTKWLQ